MKSPQTNSRNKRPVRRARLFWLRVSVAVALFVGLIWFTGVENLLDALAKVDIFLAFACAAVTVVFFLLGSINVWWLLRCRHAMSYLPFLRNYAYGFSIGLLSPGQIGDASLVLFLRRDGIPVSISSAAYAMDKLISLTILFAVALFGLYRYEFMHLNKIVMLVIALIGAVLLGFYCIRHERLENRLFQWLKKLGSELQDYRSHTGTVLGNVVLTVIKWLVLCTAYYSAFLAFGARVPWPDIGIIPVMSTLVGYIPVSIGGIGTVEMSAVMLFKALGIGEAVVLATYLLLRLLQYILALTLMGLLGTAISNGES